jgi:hypothetical protein
MMQRPNRRIADLQSICLDRMLIFHRFFLPRRPQTISFCVSSLHESRYDPIALLAVMDWENPSAVLGTFPVGGLARTVYLAPMHLSFVETEGEAGMRYGEGSEQRGAVQMRVCGRCRGFMVPCFTDSLFLEITEAVRNPSWRCVNCGEWLDQKILSNRRQRHHTGSASTEPEPRSHRRRWRRYASPTQEEMRDQSRSRRTS